MKKVFSIVLCLLMAGALFGCSGKNEINLRDKLSSLITTDEALGIRGKYKALTDITDGSIDKALVGTWKTADGETTYIFNEDGTASATNSYGSASAKYTCITVNDYKVLCQEVEMDSEDADGNTTTSTVLSYSSYSVDNGVFYVTTVDEYDENAQSSQFALVMMYRADREGDVEAAMKNNSISLDSFNGTWTSEAGEFTIADGKLTLGEEVYGISYNDKGQLSVEKDGESTAYSVNLSVTKEYDSADKSKATETTALGIYYKGGDDNAKPNLASVLEDWSDYQPNYYIGIFDLKQ